MSKLGTDCPHFMKLNINSLYEFHMVISGGHKAHHLTCVFAAMHLQMRQLEVPLAATRISTYKWTLFVGLWWPNSWWSNTRNPSNILKGEAEGEDRGLYSREVHFFIFIYRTSVNVVASVCVCVCVLTLTDLNSSEDAVCVYVVLGTDEHGWRWGYGVTVIAVCMSTAGQEQNYKWIKTLKVSRAKLLTFQIFGVICQEGKRRCQTVFI